VDQSRETDRAPKAPEAVGVREATRENAAAAVARERPGARTASNPGKLSATSARRLQAAAGNRAVARLVAQRRAASGPPGGTPGPVGTAAAAAPGARAAQAAPGAPAPVVEGGGEAVVARAGAAGTQLAPAPPAPPPGGNGGGSGSGGATVIQRLDDGSGGEGRSGDPQADPKFVRLTQDIRAKGDRMAAHPAASGESAKAQAAARPPADDREAQGKAANAEKMNAAKPGTFDKAAFVKAVNDAIAAQAPKNLDEADNFGSSGKAGAVKSAVQGHVTEGKKASAGDIERTTNAPPDTAAAKDKPVTPLTGDKPPGPPAPPDPNLAVPDKLPPSATDLSAGPAQVDQQMADADVTEDQLAKSNEPEFTGALKDKKEGEAHSAAAPPQMRASESATLNHAKAGAQAEGTAAMRSLAGDRAHAGQAIDAGKQQEQSGDEGKRKQVNAKLQQVFNTTQTEVQGILTGLDRKVDEAFTQGEKAARDAFTADHKQRMERYKDERYSGWLGKARWVKDKFAGLPAEANQIFEQAKGGYTRRMQGVIESVADIIGNELTRAKARIAQGREQIAAEVSRMPAELQAVAKDAVEDFNAKFDGLSQSVDAKSDELVDTLATRYTDAVKAVDEEIAAEKEKNKGLISKVVDAVKGVIDTILKLKDLLMGVLAKAASAVAAIIKDPIKFLGNLVSALGAGLKAFIANIGKHLSAGLMGFLLGAMAASGVLLPSKFDIQGLIMLVVGVMGLTWAAIRGRIVKRGVPEQAMTQVERVMPIAQKLHTGGVGGVWQDVKGKVGDLKGMLFSKISEYLIPTVLIAGITWILSLLNPASAFIKACKMIVDIISFIVTRGAQIATFVNAVLDAVIAIAGGALGSVPGLIEGALAKSVPVLIGALAAILGIGGIAQKIQSFVKALAKPVGKAIDWIVGKIVTFGKKLWAKLKGKLSGKDQTPEQKQKRLDDGMAAAQRAVSKYSGKWVGRAVLKGVLGAIKLRYRMSSLELTNEGGVWAVEGAVNPRKKWTSTIHVNDNDHEVSTTEPAGKKKQPWPAEVKAALVAELSKAVQTFLAEGPTAGQIAALDRLRDAALAAGKAGEPDGPLWGEFWKFFYRSRGERIHAAFKTSCQANAQLAEAGLVFFTPGIKEPDVRSPQTGRGKWWADVTTAGEWSAHFRDYEGTFGRSALGLIYRVKNKKYSEG
jgi:hypothetical protein